MMGKCQATVGSKTCSNDATHEIDADVSKDHLWQIAAETVRIQLCDAHAGFEAELRRVGDSVDYPDDACPRCGRHSVAIPEFERPNGDVVPVHEIAHTIPDTFDICAETLQ